MTTTTEFTAKHLRKGETFIGVFSDHQGNPYCAILLPGDNAGAPWQAQLDWAKSVGGDLPDRVEQAMLLKHLPHLFQKAAYWSNTKHTDSTYAWCQNFDYGSQDDYRKSSKFRARAVRRVYIQGAENVD